MAIDFDAARDTEDGHILVRALDRWFLVDAIKTSPDDKGMARIDDRWYLAEDLVAA